MIKLEVFIALFIVKFMDIITFYLKTENNKITYISYVSNNLPYAMKKISRYIKETNPNYREVYLTMKYKNSLIDKFKYFIELFIQIYHIKTSKVVIIDGNNFVISNIKKKDTKVIQIWHASGAIKKFGMDYKRKYKISNYDYIITSSSTSKLIMSSAFGVDESNVLPLGYVDTDRLFNQKILKKYKKEMNEKYSYISGKKVILYAPTFRGEAVYDRKTLDIDINKVSKLLGDEYVIICKLHPISIDESSNKYEEKNIYDLSNESIYRLFSISDILVSDFSSIIYDYTILEKSIVLYTPDLEEYKQERGLYVNYEKFAPGRITFNEEELCEAIKNIDIEKISEESKKLKYEFFDFLDGKSAERIADFIIQLM